MKLTRRGRIVMWGLVFLAAFSIGVLTGPLSIDYSHGLPSVVRSDDITRNNDRP